MNSRRTFAVVPILCCSLTLAGCNSTQVSREQTVATAGVVTGLAGGLACAAFGGRPGACAAIGLAVAAIGAIVMNAIAEADRPVYNRTASRVMSNNANWQPAKLSAPAAKKQVAWRNPDTSATGEIVPLRTFKTEGGEECREANVIYKGRELGTDKWCRGADGVFRQS